MQMYRVAPLTKKGYSSQEERLHATFTLHLFSKMCKLTCFRQ